LATNAVVANCVVDTPTGAVGAVGTPVNAGDTFSPCTKAVVAICVELSPTVAVGATGIPVNIGLVF